MQTKSEELINKTKQYLMDEGMDFDNKDKAPAEILKEFILPAMKSSKDVLGAIYGFQLRQRFNFFGKIKNLIQNKMVNTTINVIEKQSMKQQKFNELTYKAIENLIKENEDLRVQLSDVKNQK